MVVLIWESVTMLDISQSISVSFMTGIFKLKLVSPPPIFCGVKKNFQNVYCAPWHVLKLACQCLCTTLKR